MHKLEYELCVLAKKVSKVDENLGDELFSLASMSHNYVEDIVSREE